MISRSPQLTPYSKHCGKQGNQKRVTPALLDMSLGAVQGSLICLRIASALTPKAEQKQKQKLYIDGYIITLSMQIFFIKDIKRIC